MLKTEKKKQKKCLILDYYRGIAAIIFIQNIEKRKRAQKKKKGVLKNKNKNCECCKMLARKKTNTKMKKKQKIAKQAPTAAREF